MLSTFSDCWDRCWWGWTLFAGVGPWIAGTPWITCCHSCPLYFVQLHTGRSCPRPHLLAVLIVLPSSEFLLKTLAPSFSALPFSSGLLQYITPAFRLPKNSTKQYRTTSNSFLHAYINGTLWDRHYAGRMTLLADSWFYAICTVQLSCFSPNDSESYHCLLSTVVYLNSFPVDHVG